MTILPVPGAAVERNRLDCKARYDDGDKRGFEMAKDVAAFANANGGRLLIGSVERGGILVKHIGLAKTEASRTRRDIDEAVSNFVRPAPVIDFPEQVAVDDDNVVLIVDVQPFPGQAVGVRVSKEDGAGWVFPVRVGTQTRWYSPEQLVLLMDVQLRRKVQLLSAAKVSSLPIQIEYPVPNTSEIRRVTSATIDEIDEHGNSIQISSEGKSIWLSLDLVTSVWRSGKAWTLQMGVPLFHVGNMLLLGVAP